MISSTRVRDVVVAVVAALLLALAFPRTGLAWCAPLGAAALFWSWETPSWKRCFAYGWFTGWIFFTITFWWWSTTIKDDVGIFAYIAVMAGAALEALAFGAAGVLTAIARRRLPAGVLPLAAACAFTVAEWVRSIGVIGAPFAQLGTSQADTPLKVLAAYIGTSGVTLAVCILGFYFADALVRTAWKRFAIAAGAVVAATALAWIAWPARSAPAPTIPVAAIQGNIAQSLKLAPGMLQEAIARYSSMTQAASQTLPQPQLIVWPETVIPLLGLNYDHEKLEAFTELARSADATIVVGSDELKGGQVFNALFFFNPSGLSAIYEKRQLVPFAEHFPGKAWLWWLPYVGQLNGHFAEGSVDGVYPTLAGLTVAPLICWESAFGDLAYRQVRNGAQVLMITTDDAWFGTSSGPYQHAQIAQLRAIESGEYVVRAAATGISGVIAPNGTWTARAGLEEQAIVHGFVGAPVGTMFARIGPNAVAWVIALVYVLLVVLPWGNRRVAPPL